METKTGLNPFCQGFAKLGVAEVVELVGHYVLIPFVRALPS